MSISAVYTAEATATGGRDGRSKVSDGSLDIKLAVPIEMGGKGDGNNPEQLFAAGYAACYIGAMKFATTQDKTLAKVPADTTVTAKVGIGSRSEGTMPGISCKRRRRAPARPRAMESSSPRV